jgi:hypothetical protein
MDRTFVPELNEGLWDDFGGAQQLATPKAGFLLKTNDSPRFTYMRYHTGISEDQPIVCDLMDSDSSEEDDDFDWEFNDCDLEEDNASQAKENQLKLLHGCMRDKLREQKLDMAYIDECRNKIISIQN